MKLEFNRTMRLAAGSAAALLLLGSGAAIAQKAPEEKSRSVMPVSLTGPFAGPSAMLPVANYRLWAKEVNAKGGLKVAGFDNRIPIEVIEYDDTSNPENAHPPDREADGGRQG